MCLSSLRLLSLRRVLVWLVVLLSVNACLMSTGNTRQPDGGKTGRNPNIVIFYVDDLGYGDVGYNGAVGVKTPEVDRLAKEGIVFTDAHTTSATCTPSRYSMLTGQHAFRNNAAILQGDAPLLIQPGSHTLPGMLQKAGYRTGVIGKWHLGLGNGSIDWNSDIKPGPLEIGFDYSFLLPATGDRVPTVYVENHRVVNADKNDPIVVNYELKLDGYPNGLDNPNLLRQAADKQHSNTIINGISRIGYMKGGEKALWVDEEFPNVLTSKAKDFLRAEKDKPFFLLFSYHDIHVPRLPHPRFKGKSTMGPRGDAIAQMDWMAGEVMNELKKLGLADNTLVLFTSDNGPVVSDGYDDQAMELLGAHKPGGPLRGGKYSAYEAGTRVPTILWWPGKIKAGTSSALISQVDLYASFAALVGQPLAEKEAIDSQNLLTSLLDHTQPGRTWLLEESYTTSLRKGDWKYIEPLPKEKRLPDFMKNKGVEGGFQHNPQLFNLSSDIGEKHNLSGDNPALVTSMQLEIEKIRKKTKRSPLQ
ncbi:sulfatase-like hydrolase/transferase [Nibrella saemangeumensis]|uniref:Sulfatase-like hydrolase/transferase n=1 Tax=Nibrella saemangeumensis TaxID=1084526 RepID=A0ABP8MSI4_9BACT